jgi:hypothetical protein
VADTALDHGVKEWHVEQMVYVGLHPDLAVELAESGIDWHDVADQLKRGCPVDLVPRILDHLPPGG